MYDEEQDSVQERKGISYIIFCFVVCFLSTDLDIAFEFIILVCMSILPHFLVLLCLHCDVLLSLITTLFVMH